MLVFSSRVMRVVGISAAIPRNSSAVGFQIIPLGSTGNVALADGLFIVSSLCPEMAEFLSKNYFIPH